MPISNRSGINSIKSIIGAINQSIEQQIKDIDNLSINAQLAIGDSLKIKGSDVRKAALYTKTEEKFSCKA